MSVKTESQQPRITTMAVKMSGYRDAQGKYHMLRCVGRIYPTKPTKATTAIIRQVA